MSFSQTPRMPRAQILDEARAANAISAARVRRVEQTTIDRKYAREIDKLIPLAEDAAFDTAGEEPAPTLRLRGNIQNPEWLIWAEKFNRAFHRNMDALAAARGLRRQRYQSAE